MFYRNMQTLWKSKLSKSFCVQLRVEKVTLEIMTFQVKDRIFLDLANAMLKENMQSYLDFIKLYFSLQIIQFSNIKLIQINF